MENGRDPETSLDRLRQASRVRQSRDAKTKLTLGYGRYRNVMDGNPVEAPADLGKSLIT